MKHKYHQPPENLAGIVRTILVAEDVADGQSLPMIPPGSAALIYLLENESEGNRTSIWIFGRSVNARFFEHTKNFSIIAYWLKPFVVSALFDIPARQLSEDPLNFHIWNSKKAKAISDQTIIAKSTKERLVYLNAFLLNQFNESSKTLEIVRIAAESMIYNPGTDVLPNILEELKITERTLQRVFKKYVGVTPVQFRRTCQFQYAFQQLRENQFDRLSDIALEHGYADQSHFIRSFREFTDLSPNEYVQNGLSKNKE